MFVIFVCDFDRFVLAFVVLICLCVTLLCFCDFDMFVCVRFTAQDLAKEMAEDEAVRRVVDSAKLD